MQITKARPIGTYKPPQWLVEPQGPDMGKEALEFLNEGEIDVLDRNVRGWGDHNAIIRLHQDDLEWDFLAKIEED